MSIITRLAKVLNIKASQVEKTVALIDEGNTIPFIARYRKEVTGNLTDEQLRTLEERLNYFRNLDKRKEEVISSIESQEKMTDELLLAIAKAETLKDVEDIYLPYKPKKRTRATIARENGLEPLADYILNFDKEEDDIPSEAEKYLGENVTTAQDAINGAKDIIAEMISENVDFRNILRRDAKKVGMITTEKANIEADKEEDAIVYEMYFDYEESLKSIPSHRILAINRGEKEGILKVKVVLYHEDNIFEIAAHIQPKRSIKNYSYIYEATDDSYKRLLFPSIETEIRNELTEKAESQAIDVFATNLKPYIMQAPIKETVVMGLDPGFRTGCKLVVVSETGELLYNSVIYPAKPKEDIAGSKREMLKLIEKYGVGLIAIGNGTAPRETEQVVSSMLSEIKGKKVYYTIVNESGASIYSASKVGIEEFPNHDVTVRGAVSIARRVQDPMAELVKIEPKHIGVGQYQHDVNQKNLTETLDKVVEDCVNNVGVNLNTASPSLLSYVSGINKTVSKNIVAFKEENGPFTSRAQLKKVKGLGPKAFVQCAGFLRIPNGKNPLDNTAVHPESYDIAKQIMNEDLDDINIEEKATQLGVGLPTLKDIIQELKKPGRDPREDMPKPILRADVLSIDDLSEGMELKGTVRNVVDFGLFVDIGIKNDGLVHISEISDEFIKHPSQVAKVSDIVKVRIISIDKKRSKVGLSMKGLK
ncbi:MAG: RNA-binding transcriptional accessory protein [Tissierellia bacterium]|nr:RNA-binding transcriptional accessory protein [Tissierellia bacterium]